MRTTTLILLHRQQLLSLEVAPEHLISVLYSTVCTRGSIAKHMECAWETNPMLGSYTQ
jgi:hypothetical protein